MATTKRTLSYTDALAGDRDKYLAQRNKLAGRLQDILDAWHEGQLHTDAALKAPPAVILNAAADLGKITGSDWGADKFLARLNN